MVVESVLLKKLFFLDIKERPTEVPLLALEKKVFLAKP